MKLPARLVRRSPFHGCICCSYFFVIKAEPLNSIAPEVFQSFNPLFIVALTFPVMGLFAWMNKKNIEPSTPKKIGIGMIIAAVGFIVVLVASFGLPSPSSLGGCTCF